MARRFSFRLEQVLSYRRQLEEACVRRLAQARLELLKAQEAREAQKEEAAGFEDSFQALEKGASFSAEEARAYGEYRTALGRRGQELGLEAKKAETRVSRTMAETTRASKACRLLENLKEKRGLAHEAEVEKEDQAFLDDISSIAFVRRDRAERARQAARLSI